MARKRRENPPEPDEYTASAVARRVGRRRETVAKQIKAGNIPGYEIGTRLVVPKVSNERRLAGDWQPRKDGETTT